MDDILTMSVPEAGRLLGIGRCTAFKLAKSGTIPVVRLGRRVRVPKAALEDMLKNAGKQPATTEGR